VDTYFLTSSTKDFLIFIQNTNFLLSILIIFTIANSSYPPVFKLIANTYFILSRYSFNFVFFLNTTILIEYYYSKNQVIDTFFGKISICPSLIPLSFQTVNNLGSVFYFKTLLFIVVFDHRSLIDPSQYVFNFNFILFKSFQ